MVGKNWMELEGHQGKIQKTWIPFLWKWTVFGPGYVVSGYGIGKEDAEARVALELLSQSNTRKRWQDGTQKYKGLRREEA